MVRLREERAPGRSARGRSKRSIRHCHENGGAGLRPDYDHLLDVTMPHRVYGPQPCPEAYQLAANSPLLGLGLNLALPPYNLPAWGRNYYGTAFNMGPTEGLVTSSRLPRAKGDSAS